MTWRFVCNHADLIASAAPIGAGASYDDEAFPPGVSCDFDGISQPAREVAILYVHGTTDSDVPFDTATQQRDLVISAWELGDVDLLADEDDYRWSRWTSQQGTAFEFLEHDWSGGFLGGHCYPGAAAMVGCGTDTPVNYGEAALAFYMEHPQNE